MKTISNDALYNYTRSLKFHQPTANRFGTARQNPVCVWGGGEGGGGTGSGFVGSFRSAQNVLSSGLPVSAYLIGLFHFLSVQGDGCKIPGLVKSMNFQRSTAKSPEIPGGWQHFPTKFIETEIFTLTDFSRQGCRCKQEFQGKKGKKYFPGG